MTYFPNFGFELFAIAAHLSGRLFTFHSFNVNQRQSAPTLTPTRHIEMALLECTAEFTYVAWSLFWRQQVGLCPKFLHCSFLPQTTQWRSSPPRWCSSRSWRVEGPSQWCSSSMPTYSPWSSWSTVCPLSLFAGSDEVIVSNNVVFGDSNACSTDKIIIQVTLSVSGGKNIFSCVHVLRWILRKLPLVA